MQLGHVPAQDEYEIQYGIPAVRGMAFSFSRLWEKATNSARARMEKLHGERMEQGMKLVYQRTDDAIPSRHPFNPSGSP